MNDQNLPPAPSDDPIENPEIPDFPEPNSPQPDPDHVDPYPVRDPLPPEPEPIQDPPAEPQFRLALPLSMTF